MNGKNKKFLFQKLFNFCDLNKRIDRIAEVFRTVVRILIKEINECPDQLRIQPMKK